MENHASDYAFDIGRRNMVVPYPVASVVRVGRFANMETAEALVGMLGGVRF